MRASRKRRGNLSEAQGEVIARRNFAGAKKCAKKSGGRTTRAGQNDAGPGGREENFPPPESTEALWQQHGVKSPHVDIKIPSSDFYSSKVLHPSTKMKLQLFPVDEHTCETLKKDGFNPYLELTLSFKKKISSVLKHLNSKWSGSRIAQGEPVLYPYDKTLALANHNWTVNNNTISTGDVYAAVGSPAVFRLRYGWSRKKETEAGVPTPTALANFQFENTAKSCDASLRNTDGSSHTIAVGMNSSPIPSLESEAMKSMVIENALPDGPLQLNDNGLRKHCSGLVSTLWDDDLTNLSIGGLLSEASLKGRSNDWGKRSNEGSMGFPDNSLTDLSIRGLFSEASLDSMLNGFNRKPIENNTGLQDSKLTDVSIGCYLSEASLQAKFNETDDMNRENKTLLLPAAVSTGLTDASLMGQRNEHLGIRPARLESHSSILDADDTCHSFPVKAVSSWGKDAASIGGNGRSTALSMLSWDADPKSSNFQKQAEASVNPETLQEQGSGTSMFSSQLYNQDNSLGLSGIKWTESPGPFDLRISSSGKLISGASVSFSNIVKNI